MAGKLSGGKKGAPWVTIEPKMARVGLGEHRNETMNDGVPLKAKVPLSGLARVSSPRFWASF